MDKQLSELSVIELKALAYDHLAQLQLLQTNLNAINQELVKRAAVESNPSESVFNRPLGNTKVI